MRKGLSTKLNNSFSFFFEWERVYTLCCLSIELRLQFQKHIKFIWRNNKCTPISPFHIISHRGASEKNTLIYIKIIRMCNWIERHFVNTRSFFLPSSLWIFQFVSADEEESIVIGDKNKFTPQRVLSAIFLSGTWIDKILSNFPPRWIQNI